jgi:hypothetical protein
MTGPIWFSRYDQINYLHIKNGFNEYRIDSNGDIEKLSWVNYDR